MQKSQSQQQQQKTTEANRNKEKSNKFKSTTSLTAGQVEEIATITTTDTTEDRNANATTTVGVGGTIRKTLTTTTSKHKKSKSERHSKANSNAPNYANYMELNYFDAMYPSATLPTQFTELFNDFPVSYECTNIGSNSRAASPPAYRDPPPPTPPPISLLPTRDMRHLLGDVSVSAPVTPSRGKVVLSKKERKELNKLQKLQAAAGNASSASNLNNGYDLQDLAGGSSMSAHASPYKGRVTELKQCLAKLNSKTLFASLQRSSHKSSLSVNDTDDASPPPPAPADASPPSQSTNNNDADADYSEKLKNLPVRPRKTHNSLLDNYCLFNPDDFINEKAMRQRMTHQSNDFLAPMAKAQGLRDPLFSSQRHLNFLEDDFVPEVIYDAQQLEVEVEINSVESAPSSDNYAHHNYFVIDPEDFEVATMENAVTEIGIPNAYSNEQLIESNLQQNAVETMEHEAAEQQCEIEVQLDEDVPMSQSLDSKGTTATLSTTETTTSTALIESSTSTNSTSSSAASSAGSSQTTLQRSKKRLTFLNLSPFRSQSSSKSKSGKSPKKQAGERAVSELVSSEHLLHLQSLLYDGKENIRSRTVPIESNYVLFNPGPVPSRNVQYKVRKPRPISTHSDADSGFLSPCSPDEMSALKFNSTILVLQQCDSVQGYIEIYTDWANYYLERAKSKKKVTDLSADCRDGLLLADVIEAVTSFKVPDLIKKPKNQQQMYDNVNSCLNILRAQSVGGLDNITTNDICAGRLKAVLALFFALSRYKQQSKQQIKCGSVGGSVVGVGSAAIKAEIHQQPLTTNCVLDKKLQQQLANTATNNANCVLSNSTTNTAQTTTVNTNNQQQQQQQQQNNQNHQQESQQNGNDTMVNRQIPTAYSKANGGTAIPLPATVMVQRRCPPDKVRPLPPTPNHTPSIPGLGKSGNDFSSGRANSPPTTNHTIQNLKGGNNNGLRPPTVKANNQQSSGIPPPSSTASHPTAAKHSMLDKLKLFNKEKQQQQNAAATTAAATAAANKNAQIQNSKRTSSSSGFSSARSERSDSSLSLNDGHMSQIKPPTITLTSGASKSRDLRNSSSSTSTAASSSTTAPSNSKQSKLLAAQMKKDQNKALKASAEQQKEKSPARAQHKHNDDDLKMSTLGRTKNSLPRVVEKNSSKTSSKSSLSSKSDSKSSLIMTSGKNNLNSPSGTGLPKPIAAVKGTSKLPQQQQLNENNKTRLSNSNSVHEMVKREKSDISAHANHNISAQNQQQQQHHHHQQQTHIVKPVPILPEPGSKPPYYVNANNISSPQQQLHNGGSMLHNHSGLLSSESGFVTNNSSSSRLPPPKSALSPVGRKLEYNAGPSVLSPQRSPMRPLTHQSLSQPTTPTASPNKFHTIPSKIVGTIYEEEKQQQQHSSVNILPMRPLLRGYNSHVTLPTRGARGGHHYVSDFCDSDLAQGGYCSDGDALRVRSVQQGSPMAGSPVGHRFHDIDNGYLSEGSGGVGIGHTTNGHGHAKHFLSMMRARTQLPTTIEERIRNSRGSLDSIGTAPPSSAASQASSSGGSTNKMDLTNGANANGSSPQHQHRTSSSSSSSRRENGRDNWGKMGDAQKSEKSSPSRRSLGGGGSGSSSKQGSPSSGRTKGVPPSFGYVKRTNGSATSTAEQQNIMLMTAASVGMHNMQNGLPSSGGRTAHVSAVPRTGGGSGSNGGGGRKVADGTQTLPNDMSKLPSNPQHRSFSLTGPGATQLSQSIRERLATGSHSLPKPGTDLHLFQHRLSNRANKLLDGSLSDTQTYAEVKPEYSTYAIWLKHSNTAGSRLSDGDSMENMQIGSPAMTRHGHKMLHHRNNVVAAANAAAQAAAAAAGANGTESPYVQSPRLNRSNSIRSTKSEKMYPSMLSRANDAEIEPYYCLPVGTLAQNGVLAAQMAAAAAAANGANHQQQQQHQNAGTVAWSQPTSPTPHHQSRSGFPGGGGGGPLSPSHASGGGGSGANTINSIASITTSVGGHRLTYPKKNDEVHGSAASLLSGGSSLYGSAEERQANEIRRLKRELMDAREQVLSLSSQLSTNAHVVSAFEQSLSNMTTRLHHLTATAERKDGELTDMRQTIELLRKQSIQAGLTTAHMQSMGVQTQSANQNELLSDKQGPTAGGAPPTPQHQTHQQQQQQQHLSRALQHQQQQSHATNVANSGAMQRHHSSDSMCSLNSIGSSCSAQDKNKNKKKGWLRSSFTKAFSRNAKIAKTSRHVGQHHQHQHHQTTNSESYNKGGNHTHNGLHKQNGEPMGLAGLATQPAPPLPTNNTPHNHSHSHGSAANASAKNSPAKTVTLIENAKPIDAIDHEQEHHIVEDLKKQLREKDLVLTDIRLEALSSASQLENLKETMNRMRAEMMSLKQNNERLQKLVTSRSLAGSEASLGNAISPNGSIGESRRYSLADSNARPPMELPKRLEEEVEEENIPPAPAPEPPPVALSPTTHIDLTPPPPALEPSTNPTHLPAAVEELPDVTDGKKIGIACYLGQPESFLRYCEEMLEADEYYANSLLASSMCDKDAGSDRLSAYPAGGPNEFVIAYTYISGKTTWQNLDYIVRKTFKDYVSRIDPGTNLGLNTDSITSYHLGEAKRGPEVGFPELLPCGYIVGSVRTLYICLQGVGSLAFDSLIPRSIVHRYISLLNEHRRLILCGPSGTGKSYLARRLAEFLVARSGRGNPSEAIATFNVDHKSSKELRQYLAHIAEQASIANGASEMPSVIILDNLHHASALGDVFSCLSSAGPAATLPCIIGTMSQATCNTTNLQLHHNFRWVLTANHMEPVKGFLGRFLRRRLFQLELQTQQSKPELSSVLAWLPTVWQHINRFLEAHSSSDVTIGPRLFLSCPLDLKDSQVWFTDIWNYHLSPYLIEAVREGVQLYGRRGGAWNDPSAFIRNSYPWPYGPDSVPPLRQINAEDVGLEGVAANNGGDSQDPLLNMLMRLQEAANYSEHQDQESDCASIDSNVTPDSSAGAE